MARESAQVDLVRAEFVPLTRGTEKSNWASVPESLLANGAVISKALPGMGNTLDFQVAREGWVFVIGTYGYEGNSQGDWDELRWTEKDFKKHGWNVITPSELGGALSKDGKGSPAMFGKKLKRGEWMRIRTNKYSSPSMILFGKNALVPPMPTPSRPPSGFDFAAAARQPAIVDTPGYHWRQMAEGRESGLWVHLGTPFRQFGAQRTGHDPAANWPKDNPKSGYIEYTVKRDGWLLVACNYAYQGNKSGGWIEERWEPKDFEKNGWKHLDSKRMGFAAIDEWNAMSYIFAKFVKAGETQRLRCNKYGAPRLITLGKISSPVLPAKDVKPEPEAANPEGNKGAIP